MKYRNIVVAGDIGTGTTTLAKSLAEKLGFKYQSTGDFFRSYAKEHNIPLWNKAAVPDEIDRAVDSQFTKMLGEESGLVVDSHYAGWFARDLKDVFKILLICNPKVAEERIITRDHTHQENSEEVQKRRAGIVAKFKKLYSEENHEDPKFFNLVLDTTNSTPEDTFRQVINSLGEISQSK